ncbi:MAG TPA: DUF5947 family protein [Acidimicrobiia bacterium]|jgi:hypothetical protein
MEGGVHSSDLEARVDACLVELDRLSPAALAAGESLLTAAIELHTTALTTLVQQLRDAGGDAAVERAAADPRVGDVLALHGLHPTDVGTRAERALREILLEVGGGIPAGGALLGVDDGVARVSIADAGRTSGCGDGTRADEVVAALLGLVPELEAVDVIAPLLAVADPPSEVRLPMPKLRVTSTDRPAEQCELCGAPVGGGHGHGVDVDQHRLVCLCDPCRIVLGANPERRGRFRALPDRVIADPAFAAADGEWEGLGIPVSTAFFFHDSVADGIVAFYPSPAGATESLLGARDWEALAATSVVARDLAPDTEAMLVRRTADVHESYLVPVDRCYELVGLVRTHWRGFDGGQDAHDALDEFFRRVRTEARTLAPEVVAGA